MLGWGLPSRPARPGISHCGDEGGERKPCAWVMGLKVVEKPQALVGGVGTTRLCDGQGT